MTQESLNSRSRAKRDQIRDGAQRLFLENGFANTSTDAIARETGVSKQTIYVYYSSKEELLADVLQRLIENGQQYMFVEPDGTPLRTAEELRDALYSLAENLVSALMRPDYVALVRVIVAETPRLPRLGYLFRDAVPRRILGTVRMLLKQAQQEGTIGEVDADAASRMFVGSLLTYVLIDGLFVGDGPPQPPSPGRLRATTDLLMESIAR